MHRTGPLPYVWKGALVLGLSFAGLWTAAHGVAGVAWMEVGQVLGSVSGSHLLLLAALWLAGLGIYSTVLAAALPGLGVRRGLLLNLTGSAVANVVPLGGAVATAMNWRMVRLWGHSNHSFWTFCLLTNLLDVASKLMLPLVGAGALVLVSAHVPSALWTVCWACAGVLAIFLVGSARVSRRPHERELTGRHLRTVVQHVADSTTRIRELNASRWARLLPGTVGYVLAQVTLLDVSLTSVGLRAPLTAVLMAAAIERLCSLVPLTPGGTGVAEVSTIAWLVATGLDPAEVVAGVLLYRLFLIGMEIPVGAGLLGVWMLVRRPMVGRTLEELPA